MLAHPTPPASWRNVYPAMLPAHCPGATAAAAPAPTLHPPSQRRPLVHAILLRLVDDDNSRLFAYAREVLQIFGSRGVDVYLQTDVSFVTHSDFRLLRRHPRFAPTNHSTQISDPSTVSTRPITYELLDDVIAASTIDFIILISEQNMLRKSIDVRVQNTHRFVERDIEKHASFVLEEWATALARDASPDDLFALRMNPNVVTNKHVDFFLQQLPLLRGFRSAYASLARLLDCTQRWLANPSEFDSFGSLKLRDTPIHAKGSSSTLSTSTASDENTATKDSQSPNSARDPQSNEPKLPKEEWEALAKKALRHGLDALYTTRAMNQEEEATDVLKEASPNMSHMKRSSEPAARLLHGQFLVKSLHNRLVEAFPAIASAPIAVQPDHAPNDVFSVPSEAHRQRLLREVNFLIVRMEELGSRLSRRPKTRRRRRITNPMNPWSSYIDRFRAVNEQNAATRDSKAKDACDDAHSYYIHTDSKQGWRCIGCHSLNRRNSTHCRSCGTPSCILEPGLLPTDSDSTATAIRDAIKLSSQQRRAWMFAPSPVQMSPPSNSAPARGNRRGENGFYPMNRGPAQEPHRTPHLHGRSPYQVPASNQLSPDLVEPFRGLSLEDGGIGIGNGRTPHGRRYENPVSSPDSARGLMAGMSHFSGPNGSGMSKVRAIPISRAKNGFERSPPSRSPGATDYHSSHRVADEHRPASFDANMLGNSFGVHHRNGWFPDNDVGGEPSVSAARTSQSYSRSPPMFGSSLSGFPAPNGSYLESRNQMKRGDYMGVHEMPHRMNGVGRGGRYPPRTQDHFPASVLMNGNGTMSGNAVSHMEELAVGSVEAQPFNPRYIANAHSSFPPLEQRSSLEDLAAASDAANGGRGSATSESMRAVMAYRFDPTADRNRNGGGGGGGGGYGLF